MDQTIEQLQAQLTQLNADIQTAKSQGNFAKATELEEQSAKIQYQIEELQKEEANNAAYTFTVGGETINLRDYIDDEKTYQFLKIAFSQKDAEIEAQHQADLDNLTAMKDQQIQQYQSQFEAAQAASNAKYSELETQLNDVSAKLTAATAEIESLTSENAALKAKQVKPAQPTNIDSEAIRRAKKEADDAKPKIYNKRDGDALATFYIANLLETDEEIKIPYLNIGRYVVLSKEEAERFQQERKEAEAAALDAIPESSEEDVPADDQSVAVPAVGGSFPDASENAGVQAQSTVSEMVREEQEYVPMDEFKALVKRVEKLEADNQAVVAA